MSAYRWVLLFHVERQSIWRKGFARREGCHRYEYILRPNAQSARYEWPLQRQYRYFSQKDSCPSGQHQTASHPIWNPCEGCLYFDRSLINALGLEDAPFFRKKSTANTGQEEPNRDNRCGRRTPRLWLPLSTYWLITSKYLANHSP